MLNFIEQYWLGFLFSIITAMMLKMFTTVKKQLADQQKEQLAIKNGIIGLLKERINQNYTHWITLKYIPVESLEGVEMLQNQLKELIPNETVYNTLIEELRRLKHYPPKEKRKNEEDEDENDE